MSSASAGVLLVVLCSCIAACLGGGHRLQLKRSGDNESSRHESSSSGNANTSSTLRTKNLPTVAATAIPSAAMLLTVLEPAVAFQLLPPRVRGQIKTMRAVPVKSHSHDPKDATAVASSSPRRSSSIPRRDFIHVAAAMYFAFAAPRNYALAETEETYLKRRSVEDVVRAGNLGKMALWPDPMLRRTAAPVSSFGPTLAKFCDMLVRGMESRAIAAIQYGVDAQVVALKGESSPNPGGAPFVLVNPRILERSDELDMKPWQEVCLVLPPDLKINLLRDAWVTVEAEDTEGSTFTRTLRGEPARAFQHEYDHLRGVLIIDHASMDELPAEMQKLERAEHAIRQLRAFERPLAIQSAPKERAAVISAVPAASAATISDAAAADSLADFPPVSQDVTAVKARNAQLVAALLLPLFAYKASAMVQGIQLQWYLDATIALCAVALIVQLLR